MTPEVEVELSGWKSALALHERLLMQVNDRRGVLIDEIAHCRANVFRIERED